MRDWIRRMLAPPVFEDMQQTSAAGLLHTILLAMLVLLSAATAAILVVYGFPTEWVGVLTIGMAVALIGGSLGLVELNRRGHVRLASTVLVTMLWLLVTVAMYSYGGLVDVTVSIHVLTVVMAGVLLSRGAALVVFVASMLSAAGLVYVETYNILTFVRRSAEPFDLVVLAAALGLTAMVSRYALRTYERAVDRAQQGEQALAESNRELEMSQASLKESLSVLERRSAYLQASTEVGQAAALILDTDALIGEVAELIRDRFGLYFVGLFLVEAEPGGTAEWAVLRAGTGEAGQAMLARGYRIRAGEGMIGWSIEHAQARVTSDVGKDVVQLTTADLPGTRSEAALPLRSRGRVLGALSVQSEEPAAFDQDFLAVLQAMADQVAVALDNTRLLAESQAALEAARGVYTQVSREAWQALLRTQREGWGFRRDAERLQPLGADADGEETSPRMDTALQIGSPAFGTGALVAEPGEARAAAVPIKVRGQVIGVIDAQKPEEGGTWSAEEVSTLETLAEQLGVALEGARLFQDARRHAAHEQAVRHITEQMRRALEVESILQATVSEVGQALGVPRSYVRLGMGSAPPQAPVGTPLGASGVHPEAARPGIPTERSEGAREQSGAAPPAASPPSPPRPTRFPAADSGSPIETEGASHDRV